MKITSKGQVTIPQELRRKYQIDSNAEVDFVEEDGRIVIKGKEEVRVPVSKAPWQG